MSVASSDIYQNLFGQILDINPETQRLKEICRVFLELDFPEKDQLTELAFTPNEQLSISSPTGQQPDTPEGDQESGDLAIGNMSNLRDFPKLLKKQFLIPDEIFFHRLIRHDLFVLKNEEHQRHISWDSHIKEQSQLNTEKAHFRKRTYILMDVSASTGIANRLTIEKAIAIAYLENQRSEGGEVWFRTFNHHCGPPWLAKTGVDYRHLINNGIVTSKPIGQTDLEGALKTAFSDLEEQPSEDRAEILLLTDGLTPLNLSHLEDGLNQHRIHVVLIGGDLGELTQSELRDHFMNEHRSLKEEMENSPVRETRERLRSRLDQMFQQRSKNLQKELEKKWQDDLRFCAEKNGGLFLSVPDLPSASFSTETQLEDLEERLHQLSSLLNDPSTTTLEKEKLIDEVLAIRSYILDLKGQTTDSSRLDSLLKSTGKITLGSEELETMLKYAQIRWQASNGQKGESVDLFLFLKVVKESIQRWIRGKETA